jgi:membrane-bound ClpP family serine protease
MTSTAAIILGLCLMLAIVMLVAVSRHKKSATLQISLVGSIGIVDKDLEPNGTVLIQGELWRASSSDGIGLATGSKIEVTGTRDHLLLVKPRAQ